MCLYVRSVQCFLCLCVIALATAKCPIGAVQGPSGDDCFLYKTELASWYQAEQACIAHFGHLASVSDAFLNAFLPRFACSGGSTMGSAEYWLGGSKGVASQDWTWSDGVEFSYANWAIGQLGVSYIFSSRSTSGQPSTAANPDCLALRLWNSLWYDDSCSAFKPYMCKVPSIAEPTPPSRVAVPVCESGWTYYAGAQECYKV